MAMAPVENRNQASRTTAQVAELVVLSGMAVTALHSFPTLLRVFVGQTGSVEVLEILFLAFCQDNMARVAFAAFNDLFSIGGFVLVIVAAEAARPVFVADVVGVGAPICLHEREEVVAIDALHFARGFLELGMIGVLGLHGSGNFVECFGFRGIGLGKEINGGPLDTGHGWVDATEKESEID